MSNAALSDAEKNVIATKCAKQDMALARRENNREPNTGRDCAITHTSMGTLFLAYVNGVYTLTTSGLDGKIIVQGTPKFVTPVLASMYVFVDA